MKTSLTAIAPALVLALALAGAAQAQDGAFTAPADRAVPGSAVEMKSSFAPVVRAAAPAVVNIAARGVQQVQDPFWAMFGQGPRTQQVGSIGSGVIVRPNGVVVTNNHVIEGMSEIKVTLNDRREFAAHVVLADERSDVAVLQLDGVSDALPTLTIDDREQQEVGDLVLAIGNPFGVGQTVTNGIISALNRTETNISDSGSFIQTDAAINPGNSGGALVDMDGDLIGINSAIFSRSGTSSGVGFAIPASQVRRVVDNAVGGATAVVRAWLGVKGDTVTADIARSLGFDRPQGIVVTDVWPDGPAAHAGIRPGDVITAVDGTAINDQGGLNFRVGLHNPGQDVSVSMLRDGRPETLTADIQRLPGDADLKRAVVVQAGSLAGAQVVALNPALADSLGGDPFASGVIVSGVGGRTYAQANGFRQGDIITAVNGRPVSSAAQLASVQRGSEVTINRGGQRLTGVVR